MNKQNCKNVISAQNKNIFIAIIDITKATITKKCTILSAIL